MNKKPIILLFLVLIGLISSFSIFGLTGYEYLKNGSRSYINFTTDMNSSVANSSVTLVGTPQLTNTGKIGKGAYFTDFSQNLSIASSPITGNSSYSLCFWYNQSILGSGNSNVVLIGGGTSDITFRAYANNINKLGYIVYDADGNNYAPMTSTINIQGNGYNHLCFVFNGTTNMKYYVNGTLDSTQTFTKGFDGTSGMSGSKVTQFNARFVEITAVTKYYDEIFEINRSLTQTEVQWLYQNGTPSYQQQYPFNDSVIPDVINFTFLNQTPTDITNTNLFNTGNATFYYNISKTGIISAYLNYTVNNSRNIFEIVNGTVTKSGYFQVNATSNTTDIFRFNIGADNGIYPGINNLPYLTFNQSHTTINLTGTNDYLKFALYNMSFETSQYLELGLKSNNSVCRILYCNSSYVSGNVNINSNCFHFATSNNQTAYNHTHGLYSGHNIFSFTLNSSGYIGTVKVSQDGYFAVNKQSGTSCQVEVISNITRINTTQTSLTGGSSWNNINSTPDAHIHFFNTSFQDNLKYQVCAENSTGLDCDTFRTDNFEITTFPPIIELSTPDDDTINITSRYYNITWNYILTGATNINFSVYLLNSTNDEIIKNLSVGQGNNSYYNWDIVASNIPQDVYKIKVNGSDTNNLTNFDIGENFTVYNNILLNLSARYYFNNASISNFNVTVYDYDNGETRTFNATGNYSEISMMKGHLYNLYVDHPNYAYVTQNFSSYDNFNNLTVNMNATNSVYILIYDANTLNLINISTTITFTTSNSTFTFSTTNGTYLASNLTPAIYTVSFNNSLYAPISYVVTMNPDTSQELMAYMIDVNITSLIFFYVQNLASEPLNATINIQQLINTSFVTIGNKQTDLTGFTYFYLIERTTYRITLTSSGYDTRTFDFEPFAVNSPYIIKLNPTAVTSFRTIFDDVDYLINPENTTLPVGTNTFSIQTTSANGILLYTYINCDGNASNLSGFPNGATASVQVTTSASEKVTCVYRLSATGYNDVTLYKYYYTQNINNETETNLVSSMKNLKNSLGNTGSAWTTILAYFIIIGVAGTILGLTGNTIVSTFVVFSGIVGFALLGWISPTIAFFSCGIAIMVYYFTRGAY